MLNPNKRKNLYKRKICALRWTLFLIFGLVLLLYWNFLTRKSLEQTLIDFRIVSWKKKMIGFISAVWNFKKNLRPKSVFLAFTIPAEDDGRIVREKRGIIGDFFGHQEFDLSFEFSEKEKSLLVFKDQIGSVWRWNARHCHLIYLRKWSRDRFCRISGPLIFF